MTKRINRPPKKTWPKWPRKMTDEAIQKLESWATYALNDRELCLYAWVSKSTYYEYKAKNQEFSDRIDSLKESPTLKAKINLVKNINWWDIEDSKRWLERKNRTEFSKQDNIELTWKDWWPIETKYDFSNLTPEQRDELRRQYLSQ